MAKQTKQKSSAPVRPAKKAPPARAAAPKSTASRTSRTALPEPRKTKAPAAPVERGAGGGPPSSAPPPPKKPGYYEALAMYENGVRALQRHDFHGAAAQFRAIIERYPEERELQERSQLYLRVCDRETAKRPPTPQTPQERVYAATVALNAGDTAAALDHLQRAISDAPDSDHAHYIMSVALVSKGDSSRALEHLRRAITLNPDNRALARQDPDLEGVRGAEGFADLLDGPGGPARSKARKRR